MQRIVGVQHADDAARGTPRARRAAIGRRVVERAVRTSRFQLAEVVQREHGRVGHRALGVVADHHGRGAELPRARNVAAVHVAAGTPVQHHGAAVVIAAVRPEQRGMVPGREVVVALVQAVSLPARAAADANADAAAADYVAAVAANGTRPRLAPFPLHLGPAHLQPADHG